MILALLLSACETGGGEVTTENIDDVTTEAPATLGTELEGYTVIRSNDADKLTVSIVSGLFASINAMGGSELDIGNDWLAGDKDPASEEVRAYREILVGSTNRPESNIEVAQNELVIGLIGNKIVAKAGSTFLTDALCQELLKLMAVDNGRTYIKLADGEIKRVTVEEKGPYEFIAGDQKNSRITFYTVDPSYPTRVIEGKSFAFERYNIAGLKLREYDGRKLLLAAYGSRFAKMLDVESGEVLWYSDSVGANPHSVELTPNGVIAVASSTGAVLNFYSAKDAGKVVSIPFGDAHGVLYDPDTDLVYAIGANLLRVFKVEMTADGMPSVSEQEDKRYILPSGGAHDLQPVYGNTDRLWITTTGAVYQYSVSEGKVCANYDGRDTVNAKNIKGIGNYADGSVICIAPDGKFESWTAESVIFIYRRGEDYYRYNITIDTTGIYKLRVANYNYQ